MDKRINSNATHGVEVFKMSNAGASFPVPVLQQNTQEDSLHILLERAKESHQNVISAFSGHEDCVAVRSIWTLCHKPAAHRTERDVARIAPYMNIVEQVKGLRDLDEDGRIRLLTQAKTLQDINHAFQYDDIHTVVQSGELNILAYFEDVVSAPHCLYLFNPSTYVFELTELRLKEFLDMPELLQQYALRKPVDVALFINEHGWLSNERRYEKAMQAMRLDDEGDEENNSVTIISARH